MQSSNILAVELVFLLLLFFVAALGLLARKLQVPYPIVLVIGGALLGLVPGIPRVTLNPDVVFFVVLPPLLYSAAWVTPWREFSRNLVSILFLAVGLVAFTVIGVAIAAPWFFPGFDWRLGLVLGAVIAPTDAIAATSIAERIGLPKRIKDLLEGESLVNDATGLLALEFGIAIVVRGATPTFTEGAFRFLYLIVGGLAVGLLIGWVADWIERRVDDAPIEIALSILIPYVAYFTAEHIRASGVLAVVSCGLFLSRRSSRFFTPGVRLQIWAVWEALTFILNGLVFVLIGLQLPNVLEGIRGYGLANLLWYGLSFAGLVIALRIFWVFPGTKVALGIRRRFLHQQIPPASVRNILILGWAGMRGVIALAAAIALPQTLQDGSPFPERNLIIFLAFCVILVTLVLQGLTLPLLVTKCGMAHLNTSNSEESAARRDMVQAALTYLEQNESHSLEGFEEVIADLIGHYRQRLAAATEVLDQRETDHSPHHHARMDHLLRELLRIERQTAIQLRDEGKINDEVLRQLEHELDLREAGPTHVSPAV